ncbi:MAG TPA: phosphate ABC transporter substrate-binding protein PstS [Chthonomonadaceae bacterium]|nr:phosphate ABC transporter substrate-binding protein PstS [Chthonomonadaceae bacterium]
MSIRNFVKGGVVVATLLTALALYRPANAQALQGAGATFPAPIYSKWFADYAKATGTTINYQAVGSGQGYNSLKTQTVDFAASDSPLSASEEAALPGPVVHIPTVGGAVALAYNLPGINGLKLTGDAVAGIFMGRIKTWNDPAIQASNPGVNLPATVIHPVHRTDGSGTTYIFTHYLKKVSPAWATQVGAGKSVEWPAGGFGGKGSDGVAADVQRTMGGIGYVELNYAIEHKLPYASVKNKAGKFIAPSADSTAAAISQYAAELNKDIKTPTVDAPGANSYPICSVTYILVYKNSPKGAAVAKLWSWAMQAGPQAEAKTLYYAPLPSGLVKINQATLKQLR